MSGVPTLVSWASAGRGLEGDISGDAELVVALPSGTLVSVIDGLGHGWEAASAAREAERVLRLEASAGLSGLFERCHEALRKTRGVAMSLVWFDSEAPLMEWCGVGNVEGVLLRGTPHEGRRKEGLPNRGGVVGYRLPPLKVTQLPVSRGDLLVLATDGLRSDFALGVEPEGEPRDLADAIFHRCAKGTDDALVLVARYLGGAS